MRKTLLYSLLITLTSLWTGAVKAAEVTDELTWQGLGLTSSNSNYSTVSNKTFTSNAIYKATASSGQGKYIQLRSNKSDAGIVTTQSGGKVKSVTIEFNESTTDRAITVFAKNQAYTGADQLYGTTNAGSQLGKIYANAESKTLTVSGDYEYVAIRATDGAVYIDKITIVWETGGDTPVTLATPVISGETPFTTSTIVTITHEKQDAAIRYKKTGDTDWTDYAEPFTITETTTIQAVAEWDDENDNTLTSETVSKTFTKNETAANIQAFNAIAANTTNVVLTLKDAVVLGCGNNNCVINDGTAGTNIFKLPSDVTVAQGTVLNGTITGTRADYNGIPQMKDITANTLTPTAGTATTTTVQPSSLADAALFGALYKLDGVTIKKNSSDNRFYIYDGDNQIIQLYNQFKIVDPAEGTWNIEGVRAAYSTTPQFWLTKMEAAQEITYTDMTVTELCALTENKDNINLTLSDALIAYKDGSSLYIREGENAICAYGITLDGVTWKQGQTISGTVKVNSEIYRGMHEIKSNVGTTKDNLIITDPEEGTTVEPTEATIAELLAGKHVADFIILKGVEIVSDGTATAKGLNATTDVTYYVQDDSGAKIQLYTTASNYTSKADDGNKYDIKAIYASAVSGSENITPKAISETTAINNITTDEALKQNTPIYNLAGQRVGESYKGIVIVNGKKIKK